MSAAVTVAFAYAALATPALASPTITEYSAAGPGDNANNGIPVSPYELVTGPNGNHIWYTDGSYVWRMSLSGTNVTQVQPIPPNATDIVTDNGDLWFTDGPDIGCIVPSSTPTAQVFPIPVPAGGTTPSADGITVDRLGALWFTDIANNSIDDWSVGSGCVTHGSFAFATGAQLSRSTATNDFTYADSITIGPNGNIWFAEAGAKQIGEMTPAGSMVGSFPSSGSLSGEPLGIVSGPDGNLWFTESSPDTIGRVTPSGAVTEFPLAGGSGGSTSSILSGPDGNLWFTYSAHGVGCITTAGNAAIYSVPTASAVPDGITLGPDGALWFAEGSGANIGRLAPVTCGATSGGGGSGGGGAGGGGGSGPPPPPVSAPANTSGPAISGTPKPGTTLRCDLGTWTNSPTSYAVQWYRNGTLLAGATSATYRVGTLDDGATLVCVVTAANAGGSASATSRRVKVPLPFVPRCPGATGRMTGSTIGQIALGMTRARARFLYRHHSDHGQRYLDFFCLTPIGVRVGYASPKLLDALPKRERNSFRNRVVWASTSDPYYSLAGIRAGESIAAASRALGTEPPFHIGLNYWYLARKARYTAVLKVRGGVVQELGIAASALTSTRRTQAELMHSFE